MIETTNGSADQDLEQTVRGLNQEALELARAAIAKREDPDVLEERGRDLDARLEELIDAIRAAPEDTRQNLIDAWSDARLDVTFVLGGARGPTSLRLGHELRERTEEP